MNLSLNVTGMSFTEESLAMLVAGILSQRPEFDAGPFHVIFILVATVGVGQVLPLLLQCSPVSIIPPTPHPYASHQNDKLAKPDDFRNSVGQKSTVVLYFHRFKMVRKSIRLH
jgi:hypothetical protein